MKWPLVTPDSAIGIIFTFMSIATLLILLIGGIAIIVYAAFWLESALMMGVLIMSAFALPIAWLEYVQR